MPKGIKPSPEASISSGVAHFRMTHLNRREVVMVRLLSIIITINLHFACKISDAEDLHLNLLKGGPFAVKKSASFWDLSRLGSGLVQA